MVAGALASVGISDESVVEYETEIKGGRFLVLAHGSAALVAAAHTALGATSPSLLRVRAPRPAEPTRANLVQREEILEMLSDDEVAQVSMAETGAHLPDGAEFVDLGHLDRGVQTAHGNVTVMSRVLPKVAVREATWADVRTALTPTPTASAFTER